MDAQQIFDRVARHLAKQGRQSMTSLGGDKICAYRGRAGLKCAAGVLIRDREYQRRMEGNNVRDLDADDLLPKRLRPHLDLLMDLQAAHDDADSGDSVRQILQHVAARHRLKAPILDRLTFPEVWR